MGRIAFIFSQFPSYDETFILRELVELKAAGLDFMIFSLKPCKDKITQTETRDFLAQTVYHQFFSFKILKALLYFMFTAPLRFWGTFFYILKGNLSSFDFLLKSLILFPQAVYFALLAKELGLKLIHGQWATHPTTCAIIVSRLTGIPYSITCHAHDIFLNSTMLAEKIRRASFITTCTSDNKRYLLSLFKRKSQKEQAAQKIYVSYHGLNLERFRGVEAQVKPAGVFRILSVGSLLYVKGFDLLIKACRILKERGLNFECTIAGGGKLEKELKALVSELKLEPQVKFTGYITQEYLLPLYQQSDVLALPARKKVHFGIPNVLLEAMACGLPVLITPLPSIPELIAEGKTGFLIPDEDPPAIADQLIKLAASPELREQVAKPARQKIEEQFDIKKNAGFLVSLFNKALEASPSRSGGSSLILRRLLSSIIYGGLVLKNLFFPAQGVRILTYHRVRDAEGDRLSVSPRLFARQLEYLKQKNYRVIGLKELPALLKEGGRGAKIPPKTLVITFDDGSRDLYRNAYPLLRQFNFPAAIFLVGEKIGNSEEFLSWEMVEEMKSGGLEFGSHSLTHPELRKIPLENARQEILLSRRLLEQKGLEVEFFCYPRGDFNPEVKQLVKEAGYQAALSVMPGLNRPGTDLYALKRTEISSRDNLFDFKKKLSGAYDLLHLIWQRVSR